MKMLERYYDQILADDDTMPQAVDITNAAQWYIAEHVGEWIEVERDFPALVPPWPATWMEFKPPASIRVGKRSFDLPELDRRMAVGCLIRAFQFVESDDERTEALQSDVTLERTMRMSGVSTISDVDQEYRRKALATAAAEGNLPRWLVSYDSIREYPNSVIPDGHCEMLVNNDGLIIPGSLAAFERVAHSHADAIGTSGTFLSLFHPFFFAVSLLHCKNVQAVEASIPSKVQQKREKRGIPAITFKTLVVEPLRQQIRQEASKDEPEQQSQIKRALHIARGHFKDYRTGGGLFGKLHGLYWWDMQLRGSADAGMVIKDYEIR